MPDPNAIFDNVIKLSPPQAELKARKLKGPLTVTVNFGGGGIGQLDMSIPRSAVWAKRLDFLKQNKMPAYVVIDPQTKAIIQLLVPEISMVVSLVPQAEGDLIVKLAPSQALHLLNHANPDFEMLRNALQSAMDSKSVVLVTWKREKHEIIDVRPLPEGYEGKNLPPSIPPTPLDDDPVTPQRAHDLFNMMNATSCDSCAPVTPCIPFKFPTNGCHARAYEMCYLMMAQGEAPRKVYIYNGLVVATSNDPDCQVGWWYHVAPTLDVQVDSSTVEKWVIDPSVCDGPVTVNEWRDRQHDPSVPVQIDDQPATTWYPGGVMGPYTTLGYSAAERASNEIALQNRRNDLEDQCEQFGPTPYSCPIVTRCFFIMDRNTFGEDEVNALLHGATPAYVEAAFYVVVDGFAPGTLGITASTPEDMPDVKPNVVPATTLQDIEFEASHLAMEYPLYLNRRQRVTWTYRVKFTGVDDFATEQAVTLNASIAGVTASAVIYLIKQPNPYETDGEISWLSTDLRVFQIRPGQLRFNATMGSNAADAPAFIQQVINNLNNHTSGGQTFEADISTDQQVSCLELSQTAGGTRVFNFGVAKVHYRSLAADATNVRVFFRLFPVSSTVLEYYQDIGYRRGGAAGVVIPRLGIQSGHIASIPCFATARINTLSDSMDSQTDSYNVQPMPHNASGAEVIRYFGCWLDINQGDQPQFPESPSGEGPFPAADRETIQDLIRGRHQCLVAEIAFDPAPISGHPSPAASDKLAQRNLAIVESANPGNIDSHRVPQTFEIRPTRANLEAGELPDELMINWGKTPVGSLATIYLPGASAGEIFNMAMRLYRSTSLVQVDEHTLQCRTGGVTYIPIPAGGKENFAGMITVELPKTVKEGQVFTIVVRQVTGATEEYGRAGELITLSRHESTVPSAVLLKWRRVLGTFQITIPVHHKEALLEPEERLLGNLRWIQKSINEGDRWFPVFDRYVKQVARRVDALGGHSKQVVASPSDEWMVARAKRCRALALCTGILLALLTIVLGACSGELLNTLAFVLLVLLVIVGAIWLRSCRPKACGILKTIVAGVGTGAVILAILLLFGVSTSQLVSVLSLGIIVTGVAALAGWIRGCF
ncbi:MAG: protein-glutamine glutaminase family protein [Dehalococcoidia bacterium]|nr:protein-glutamine glutaminase family protein [Dehalococcoidia bacterium]